MKRDEGVIYVVLEHFLTHLHPRARRIQGELDAGHRITDGDLDHVARILEEARLLRPLIERHPEHRELAEGFYALYANIATRALENETSLASVGGSAGR